MIVVKVELHSARTGKITELGRMLISNDGTSKNPKIGNYIVKLGRKGYNFNAAIYKRPLREGRVLEHKRLNLSIWVLVLKALKSVGF